MIDAHVHLYESCVIKNPRKWADEQGEHHWADCVAPVNGKSIQGWATLEQLLRDMDQAGIEKAVLLGWYWENHETCITQNRWYRRWKDAHPDRLIAFANVNALACQAAIDELTWAHEHGFRGLGECLPQAQGYTLRTPKWLDVVSHATQLGFPINLHVTEPVGRNHPGRIPTPLEDFQWLAEQFPETSFILAHLGGLLPLHELNNAFRKTAQNLYYDTAAVPLLYRKSVYKHIIEIAGADKLIFGTDYPLLVKPKTQRVPTFEPILEDLKSSGIDEADLKKVCSQNMARLLAKK